MAQHSVAASAKPTTALLPVTVPSSSAISTVSLELRVKVSSGPSRFALIVIAEASRAARESGLLKSGGYDLRRQGKIRPQIFDSLVCEVVVVPLPVESLLDVAL